VHAGKRLPYTNRGAFVGVPVEEASSVAFSAKTPPAAITTPMAMAMIKRLTALLRGYRGPASRGFVLESNQRADTWLAPLSRSLPFDVKMCR
jgi:hypothetical protein